MRNYYNILLPNRLNITNLYFVNYNELIMRLSAMKNILLCISLISGPIYAGCGGCDNDKKETIKNKTSSVIMSVPKRGKIEGFTLASCGMCNFNYRGSKGCSLAIKIDDKVYPVEGTSIREHGDPHSTEGMCNSVRVAYVSGDIKKKKFYSRAFTLIDSPK